MRFLPLIFLTLCLNAQTINQQIDNNKTALSNKEKKASQINAKLQELGEAINNQEKKSKELEKAIQNIEENIAKNQKEYTRKTALIKELSSNQNSLIQTRKNIEKEIIELLLKDISFIMLLNDFQPESIKDLITEESFKTLSSATKSHLQKLSQKQSETAIALENLQKEITQLKDFIDKENKKRKDLQALQNQQTQLIINYQKEITQYNNALQKIVKERDEVQKILVDLQILKSQEEEKRKKLEALAKAEEEKPKTVVKDSKDSTPKSITKPSIKTPIQTADGFDVRQVASSYHNISTTKYKGAKTIAPLDNFVIEKHFGPYFDPVYKIKVFNESITLTPKGDDKVKSVLDGKVVFAKDTPILKRVVIIEHKDNIHTIYAQLDKIAPTIKPGRTVKKGYTIGRVENALKFEVTLKDKHINPLEFIKTKNI